MDMQLPMKLRDYLTVGMPEHSYLVHESSDLCVIGAEVMASLTEYGREQYKDVLDADVIKIRPDEYGGPAIVLSNVEPQRMLDMAQTHDALKKADLQLGDPTP